MSTRSLPPRPNLEHLQKQAKDLLKAHKASEPEALARFRDSLPPLSETFDAELAQSKPKSTEGMTMQQRNGR